MLAGAWLTARWALADSRQASNLQAEEESFLGLEYIDAFPISDGWQIVGAVKVLAGIGAAVILAIVSRRHGARKSTV